MMQSNVNWPCAASKSIVTRDCLSPGCDWCNPYIESIVLKTLSICLTIPLSVLSQVSSWDDISQMVGWVLNERADILWTVGLRDEAIAQLGEARLVPEDGRLNSSQSLNLAKRLAMDGQPSSAASILTEISPYFQTRNTQLSFADTGFNLVELMVAVQEGSRPATRRELRTIENGQEADLQVYQDALLIVGSIDDAAALLIQRLEELDTRRDALLYVQQYIVSRDRSPPTEFNEIMQERKAEMLARPEVRATIETYG